MYKIESLKNRSFESLFESFKDAFADYEMQLEKEELKRMLTRRGFVPELSFGAFDGEKLVAFTFNGIGTFNGVKTAYDTGTGTMKDYRGKGLATQIFEYSLPFLKNAGVKQYLLEVLQHNLKAVSLYKKLGFEVTREFNYFSQNNESILLTLKNTNSVAEIKPINLDEIDQLEGFLDFNPSWQNNIESILRNKKDFKAIGAFYKDKLVGFCVTEMISGDITQIAVDKNYRRKGIGTKLLNEAMNLNLFSSVKCINTEINCESITKFMEYASISLIGKQFEMIKKI